MIRACAILLLLTAPAAAATFIPADANDIEGISADGSVVLLKRSVERGHALLWTRQQTTPIASPAGHDGFLGLDISADGATVVGDAWKYYKGSHVDFDDYGAVWTRDGFAVLDDSASMLWATSADGSISVGGGRPGTILYDGNVTPLPLGRGNDISADGTTVVGYLDSRPYLWNGSGQYLSDALGFATHVTADGSTAFGTFNEGIWAFRWTAATGAVPIPDWHYFNGISSDGAYGVGIAASGGALLGPQGTVSLAQYFPSGWSDMVPFAVADDGLTIAGRGANPDGKRQAWILDLGPPWLPGDANRDGRVDLSDFGALKANFGTGRSWAYGDFDGDGLIGLEDFGILKAEFGVVAPEPAGARLMLAAAVVLALGWLAHAVANLTARLSLWLGFK